MALLTKEHISGRLLHYNNRATISTDQYPHFKRAAVLVTLFPKQNELYVLLTVRTNEVETHKGQISFPGGMQDKADANAMHTALREANEELGINAESVEVLGLLDDIATPTRYIITPVVGYLQDRPTLSPNTVEVAEVIDVPLSFFSEDSNGRWEMREREGLKVKVWFFQYGQHLIWGATAMMLRNLVEIVHNHPESSELSGC